MRRFRIQDRECVLAPFMILKLTLLLLLPLSLRGLLNPPSDLRSHAHAHLLSKKLPAVCACGSTMCRMALISVRDRYQCRFFSLAFADFVCAKSCPECFTSVSNDIDNGGAVVIMRMSYVKKPQSGSFLFSPKP